jgi:hypothetical protein
MLVLNKLDLIRARRALNAEADGVILVVMTEGHHGWPS